MKRINTFTIIVFFVSIVFLSFFLANIFTGQTTDLKLNNVSIEERKNAYFPKIIKNDYFSIRTKSNARLENISHNNFNIVYPENTFKIVYDPFTINYFKYYKKNIDVDNFIKLDKVKYQKVISNSTQVIISKSNRIYLFHNGFYVEYDGKVQNISYIVNKMYEVAKNITDSGNNVIQKEIIDKGI